MEDGNEIDPEIFEFLENEFLTYGFFDDPPNNEINATNPATNRNPSFSLFDLHGSRTRNQRSNGPADEDLTPVPNNNYRNPSFDSNPLLSTSNVYDMKFYCSLNEVQGPKHLFTSN